MLFTVNILPLVLMYVLLARLVERFGTTDWGRIFVMAAATLGTLLNTFAVVLNNHIVAAVSATVAMYAFVRISADGERRWRYFFVAGLAAAFTAANELPALTLLAFVGLVSLWHAPRQTLPASCPALRSLPPPFLPRTGSPTKRSDLPTPPQRNESGRQLVPLHLHGQRQTKAKLLAQSPGHRPRRADQVAVCAALRSSGITAFFRSRRSGC